MISRDPLVNIGLIKQQSERLIRDTDYEVTCIIGGCIRYGSPVLLPCTPRPLSTDSFQQFISKPQESLLFLLCL